MGAPSPETDRDFRDALDAAVARTERALDALLPPPGEDGAGTVAAAMRHAALSGGKRLRGFLAIQTAALFGADPAGADRVAAALECVHAYSLVHDDLPCMDDDATRRGQPTVHVKWDEATAVLAGDALQTLAFEILADPATHPDGGVRAALALALARAAGQGGMVGGQAIDIAAENAARPLTLEQIERLQALKTGALIECAAVSGAMLGGASEADLAAIRDYAADLGLAFQIRDDLLDVEGDAAALGKAVAKDAAAGKATFVSLMGADRARAKAEALAEAAARRLAPFGADARPLALAATFAVRRRA